MLRHAYVVYTLTAEFEEATARSSRGYALAVMPVLRRDIMTLQSSVYAWRRLGCAVCQKGITVKNRIPAKFYR